MIEVFIAYGPQSPVDMLEMTLGAWDIDGLEPVAIEVVATTARKYEIERRVAAENISRATYVLAELGLGPVEEDFAERAHRALKDYPKAGLIRATLKGCAFYGAVPALCRKGLVRKWSEPKGSQGADVLWDWAHSEAYRLAGYDTITCKTLHYHPLVECLPS